MGYDEKVTSNKTIIPISHQRCKGGNRDYCNHFSVIFEIMGKFVMVFVRLILGNVEVDGFTEPHGNVTSDMNLN